MPIPITASASRPSSTAVSTSRPPAFGRRRRPRHSATARADRPTWPWLSTRHARRGPRQCPAAPRRPPRCAAGRPTLSIRFTPGGDDHVRPRRPRPAVCRSATTARPSPAPRGQRLAGAVIGRADLRVELDGAPDPPRRIGRCRPGSVVHARIIAVQVYTRPPMSQVASAPATSQPRGPRACLLRHPALGRLAPGQLPRRPGQLRARCRTSTTRSTASSTCTPSPPSTTGRSCGS